MQRVKFALAGVAVAAALVLSGCQNDPEQAVSMNGFSLREQQVERTAEEIEADVKVLIEEAKRQGQQVNEGPIRGDLRLNVVQLTVFNELARRYAQERGYQVPAPDYASIATQIGLPADDPYVPLYADADAYRNLLLANVAPATPTEADVKAVYAGYRRLQEQSGQPGGYTEEELKAQIVTNESFRRGLGVRNELMAAAQRYGLVVNPRYAPLEFPLAIVRTELGPLTIAALPLGDQGTGAVRDVS
jgi:hypothetical protein